jgi:hypothetical protein
LVPSVPIAKRLVELAPAALWLLQHLQLLDGDLYFRVERGFGAAIRSVLLKKVLIEERSGISEKGF